MSTVYERSRAALKAIFNAIPKGKFAIVIRDATELEAGFNELASTLDQLRGYFLQSTGEESPFVKKIDGLIPRRSKGGAG